MWLAAFMFETLKYLAVVGYSVLAVFATFLFAREIWRQRQAVRERAVLRATRRILDRLDRVDPSEIDVPV